MKPGKNGRMKWRNQMGNNSQSKSYKFGKLKQLKHRQMKRYEVGHTIDDGLIDKDKEKDMDMVLFGGLCYELV